MQAPAAANRLYQPLLQTAAVVSRRRKHFTGVATARRRHPSPQATTLCVSSCCKPPSAVVTASYRLPVPQGTTTNRPQALLPQATAAASYRRHKPLLREPLPHEVVTLIHRHRKSLCEKSPQAAAATSSHPPKLPPTHILSRRLPYLKPPLQTVATQVAAASCCWKVIPRESTSQAPAIRRHKFA